MAFSNADKQQHGQSAQTSLESILNHSKDAGYLLSVTKTFRVGMPGYGNDSQFYTPFLIEFQDGTHWALFTTTSMRTDRIKGQQWDATNLKSIVNTLDKVYLIFPDACSEESEFIRQNEKYTSNYEYSAIDGVISQNQISNLIEEYALRNKSVGQIKDIQGNSFEHRIATILSYAENLQKWKTNAPTLEGIHYGMFKTVVDCFELDPETTSTISATSDKSKIGKLPSGGNPKTDVLVEVTNTDGYVAYFTISCKRSSDKVVSVHQYTADAFADVLNQDDASLRSLLCGFQAAGSMSAFGEENCQLLQERLKPYIKRLALWVLGGVGGGGNPVTQCADFILTYDNSDDTARIHRLEEYYKLLVSNGTNDSFGTPFSWTYPSKRRGESIQLKCKIIK